MNCVAVQARGTSLEPGRRQAVRFNTKATITKAGLIPIATITSISIEHVIYIYILQYHKHKSTVRDSTKAHKEISGLYNPKVGTSSAGRRKPL